MAWLVRIRISDPDDETREETERCFARLHDKRPDLTADLKVLDRSETRQHLRARGLSLSSFARTEFGVVTFPDALFAVPNRYGTKLAKALHYLHTGRIVPKGAFLRVQVYPNADYLGKDFPRDAFTFLQGKPALTRSGKSLADQFSYLYGTTPDGGGSAFLVQFGESTAIALLVVENPERDAPILLRKDIPIPPVEGEASGD